MPSMVASTTSKLVAGCEAAGDATQIPYMADSTTTPCRRPQNPMRISMLRVNWPQSEIHTPISGVPEGTVTSVIGPLGSHGRRPRRRLIGSDATDYNLQ